MSVVIINAAPERDVNSGYIVDKLIEKYDGCKVFDLTELNFDPSYEFKKGDGFNPEFVEAKDTSEIPCISFFHEDMSTENYALNRTYNLENIHNIDSKDCVIAESASIFSFVTEACAVSQTPLYTGARFANILLGQKKVNTSSRSLLFK
jgi:hypothetical protein